MEQVMKKEGGGEGRGRRGSTGDGRTERNWGREGETV